LKQWQGDKVYLLDLHTTTASGGIFTLPTRQKESLQVAKTMHAPVITGLVERLQGTLLRYYTQIQPDERMVGIVFEAGQHDDPLSINRSIAAVINCMRTVGCVLPEHIVNHHDQLLLTYAEGLPRVARLLYSHSISSDDEFRMLPGFRNFQPVRKGQLLAHDRLGEIHAREDGLILMPHYQKQGNDGFFLVREV
jgi:succinylglutamate desuccinylase